MTSAARQRARTKNEREWHPSLYSRSARSFLFVPTAGMRIAPDVLVLELTRELCFETPVGEKAQQLNPDQRGASGEPLYEPGARAVLYAVRGRARKPRSRRSEPSPCYAPAYPSLAQHSWLRRRTDRVIRDFLLEGAIRQYLQGSRSDILLGEEEIASSIVSAMFGQKAASGPDPRAKEILSVPIRGMPLDLDLGNATERLRRMIREGKEGIIPFKTDTKDELSSTITEDLIAICRLEAVLARIQWLSALKTFLRIALSSYLLAHMRLTVAVKDWLLGVLEGGATPRDEELISAVHTRNRGLLFPTNTPTYECEQHVERYMRARVELNVLLHWLDELEGSDPLEGIVTLTSRAGGSIPLEAVLVRAAGLRDAFGSEVCESGSISVRQALTRESEKYGAWKNPLKKGQGKNIDEFLRVLRRSSEGDGDDGYLVTPVRRGGGRRVAFRTFPGPLLLEVMVYLADRAKRGPQGEGGKLMLSDLEEHFRKYGIDFGGAAEARPRLIARLLELALLRGSPDAGESAELLSPFKFSEALT